MAESFQKGYKKNTSNFSCYNSVLKKLVLQTGKNKGLFGRGLTILNMEKSNYLVVWLKYHNLHMSKF